MCYSYRSEGYEMRECVDIKQAMLSEHVGKIVTVILDASQNNVFQGVLGWRHLSGAEEKGCWVITAARGIAQRGPEVIAIPETEIFFVAEDLKHIVVPKETEEEAAARIEAENKEGIIISPGGGHLQ
jgi:hypothetical protein